MIEYASSIKIYYGWIGNWLLRISCFKPKPNLTFYISLRLRNNLILTTIPAFIFLLIGGDSALAPKLFPVPIEFSQSGSDACESRDMICVSVFRARIYDKNYKFFGYSTPSCSAKVTRNSSCKNDFKTDYALKGVIVRRSPKADEGVLDVSGGHYFCMSEDQGKQGRCEFANCVKPSSILPTWLNLFCIQNKLTSFGLGSTAGIIWQQPTAVINLVSLSLTANFSSVGKIIMTSLMPVFDLMLISNRGCFDMKGKSYGCWSNSRSTGTA